MQIASVRRWHIVCTVLVTLFCSTTSRGETPGLLVQDGQTVAFLGDSITQYGWEKPGGYVKLVVAGLAAEGVKIIPVPAGISGNTSRDMVARLDRSVLSKKPQWMTLSCGVNDVWHGANGGVALEQYKLNIAKIVDEATAAGIKVLILTSTPIMEDENNANNKLLAAYNDYLRQLAKEKGLPLADLAEAFKQALATGVRVPGSNMLTVDGVHMNPAGNVLMAREILKGFGVPESDFGKIDAAWDTMPGGAAVDIVWKGMTGSVTRKQFHALESAAKTRNVGVNALANRLFLDSLRDVLAKHTDDMPANLDQITGEVRTRFEEQINAVSPEPK